MTTSTTQIKKKRGRPPLSAAKKMQRNKAAQSARATHKALRTKIALLKANFKERLRVATQEAYQKALEKVVKIERKKMEANYKALAVAKAKFGKKHSKAAQRMMMAGRRVRPSQTSVVKKGTGLRKRGRPRKMK
jgi:Zn-dependent metalloprotease